MICLADTKIIVHKCIHVRPLLGPDFVSLIYTNAESMARQCWCLLGIPPIPLKVPSAVSYICQVYGLSLLFPIYVTLLIMVMNVC